MSTDVVGRVDKMAVNKALSLLVFGDRNNSADSADEDEEILSLFSDSESGDSDSDAPRGEHGHEHDEDEQDGHGDSHAYQDIQPVGTCGHTDDQPFADTQKVAKQELSHESGTSRRFDHDGGRVPRS